MADTSSWINPFLFDPISQERFESLHDEPMRETPKAHRPQWEQNILRDLAKHTPATDDWFKENNYRVAKNNGSGMNCLLISLLQHATGRYDDEHEELVQKIRAKLEKKHESIQPGEMLEAFPNGDPILQDAVRIINRKLGTKLDPIIVYPTKDGHPEKEANEKIEIGSRKNLIVYGRNGLLHYEAVTRA